MGRGMVKKKKGKGSQEEMNDVMVKAQESKVIDLLLRSYLLNP